MTLQEFEAQGRCEGCPFYSQNDQPGEYICTFHWYDDDSDDWEYGKNCDELNEF